MVLLLVPFNRTNGRAPKIVKLDHVNRSLAFDRLSTELFDGRRVARPKHVATRRNKNGSIVADLCEMIRPVLPDILYLRHAG